MNLKRSVYTFAVAVALVASQGYYGVDAEAQESRDSRGSIQAARQSLASMFNSLLDSILQIRNGNSPSVTPQYKLAFSVGAGGKVVEQATGFECVSECAVQLTDVLRTSYQVVPDDDYQFAGWSGDICNTPDEYLSSVCDVSINWKQLGRNSDLRIGAQFARKANIELAGSTGEFEVSSYGFGGFYTDEMPPVTCYPTIDNCMAADQADWRQPDNYAVGDFNSDGYQDLFIMPFGNNGFLRKDKVRPTIFLNNRRGGLYRSDKIFAGGKPTGMFFGYRVAVEDFNGDGRDDVVIGAFGIISREPHNYMEFVPERYIVYLSGDDGLLHDSSDSIEGQENGATMPDMGFAHDLATGDIDGDGDIDIWMADRLFENDGSGNFEISKYLSDIVAQPDGYAMSSLIADFDDDGIGDLVVGRSDPNSEVWLYLSNGESDLVRRSIDFLPEGRFGMENTKHNHMAASDLDGDGDRDIVIGQTRADPYYQGRELQILINDGEGNFTDETEARLGEQTFYSEGEAYSHGEGAVKLLDVNADGFIDIFDLRGHPYHSESAPVNAAASIWLNDGTGKFIDVPPTVFPVVEPRDLAPHFGNNRYFYGSMMRPGPIDIDNDGLIDMASFVVTNDYPDYAFGESTLYMLKAKKKLKATDYAEWD